MKQIQSQQNPKFKEWRKLKQRKWREKTGRYLVEGEHLVQEALNAGGIVETLLVNEAGSFSSWPGDTDIYQLSPPLFQLLADTETPQGVLAVCRVSKESHTKAGRRFLLIDGVQDPGNLGTMIRTADAAGIDQVYLGTGCVDLFNDKVLRSAQGSHFHLPVIRKHLPAVIADLHEREIPVYGTSLDGIPLGAVTRPVPAFAIILGNEGSGVDPELLKLTDANIKIPMYGQAESLNVAVAAGILMYVLRGL